MVDHEVQRANNGNRNTADEKQAASCPIKGKVNEHQPGKGSDIQDMNQPHKHRLVYHAVTSRFPEVLAAVVNRDELDPCTVIVWPGYPKKQRSMCSIAANVWFVVAWNVGQFVTNLLPDKVSRVTPNV